MRAYTLRMTAAWKLKVPVVNGRRRTGPWLLETVVHSWFTLDGTRSLIILVPRAGLGYEACLVAVLVDGSFEF